MVNLGLNWSSLLGIILAVAGAALYFLRSWRPKLARDHDIFFAAVGLLCGGILLFQGWRLDPILAFGQFLLTGTAIFFAAESINLRGVSTQQAKSRAPIVDDERPVSSVYTYDAEIEELEPIEDYAASPRRLRGDRNYRSSRPDAYEDDYRRRPPSRSGAATKPDAGERPPKRRPRPEGRPASATDDWDIPTERGERPPRNRGKNDWDIPLERDERASRSREREDWDIPSDVDDRFSDSRDHQPPSATRDPEVRPTRPKRRRPPEESSQRNPDIDAAPTDYVEYRPVDSLDDDLDNLE